MSDKKSVDQPGKRGPGIWLAAVFAILFAVAAIGYIRERGDRKATQDKLDDAMKERDALALQLKQTQPTRPTDPPPVDGTSGAVDQLRQQLELARAQAQQESARAMAAMEQANLARTQATEALATCEAALAQCRANKTCPPVINSKPCPTDKPTTDNSAAECMSELAREKKRRIACEAELESGIRSTLP